MNRRDFIRASTAGLAAATIPAAGGGRAEDNIVREAQLGSLRSRVLQISRAWSATADSAEFSCAAVFVLSLDPRVGDFEKADVLITEENCRSRTNGLHAANALEQTIGDELRATFVTWMVRGD